MDPLAARGAPVFDRPQVISDQEKLKKPKNGTEGTGPSFWVMQRTNTTHKRLVTYQDQFG